MGRLTAGSSTDVGEDAACGGTAGGGVDDSAGRRQVVICFAGAGDEDAVRRYAAAWGSAEGRAEECGEWWRHVAAEGLGWRCLRDSVTSLRCETRAALQAGENVIVVAEVLAVHAAESAVPVGAAEAEGTPGGGASSGAVPRHEALLWRATRGYHTVEP